MSEPVVLDLFCGAGGMSLGFAMAGYRIGLGVEKEDLPFQTHSLNFGGKCHQGDIRDITNPKSFVQDYGLDRVDVVIGGPPCQGFSRVGRGKIRSLRRDPAYIHDPRNQFYTEFVRFIESIKPSHFVMENVPDLQLYLDGDKPLLQKAIRAFEDIGYVADWRVLEAHHYGVPQTRKRLFIVGVPKGQKVPWPTKTHERKPVTVWQAISDLPVIPHGHRKDEMPYQPRRGLSRYQRLMRQGSNGVLYNHQTRWHNEQDLGAFAWLQEGGKYVDLPDEYKRYRDDIFKDKYWKLYRGRPSWTIEAHIGKDSYRHIYPSRDGEAYPPRTISVREAARLQSFPDHFRFCGPFTRQFMQVGNAVPPLLSKAVAEVLRPSVMEARSISMLAAQ
jgi:DNA (cytosine-5)-methyltransferase 1